MSLPFSLKKLWRPAAALLAACTAGCAPEAATRPAAPPVVVTAKPLVADVPILAEIIGQTEATANVGVRARIEATVEKITFTEGASVQAGDTLFLLDRKPVEQRIAAAEGNLGQVRAGRARAKNDVERLTPLAASGAVPRKDLDVAKSLLQQASEAENTALAQLETAKLDLGYTVVKAPVSGVTGAKQADAGALVGKGEPTLLVTISPLDPIQVTMEVSEVTYLNFAPQFADPASSTATFSLLQANGKVHPHPGKLVFADRTVNPSTGTLKVRVAFPNPGLILRPGLFCRLRVHAGTDAEALLLPQRAIQEVQGQHHVFLVDSAGNAAFRPVTMGRRTGSLWIVQAGLTKDDTVIIEGLQKARNGFPVTAQPGKIDETSLAGLKALLPPAAPPAGR